MPACYKRGPLLDPPVRYVLVKEYVLSQLDAPPITEFHRKAAGSMHSKTSFFRDYFVEPVQDFIRRLQVCHFHGVVDELDNCTLLKKRDAF
jgi:hypothetical protein